MCRSPIRTLGPMRALGFASRLKALLSSGVRQRRVLGRRRSRGTLAQVECISRGGEVAANDEQRPQGQPDGQESAKDGSCDGDDAIPHAPKVVLCRLGIG